MNILAIDTSAAPLTIATAVDQKIIAQALDVGMKSHSVKLMPAIDTVVKQTGFKQSDIDRIIVAQGPGSFTGIRLAVTTAKMLAWTLDAQLVGVSSLAVLARNVRDFSGCIVPFFDARNGNVFAGVYQEDAAGDLQNVLQDSHIALLDLLAELQKLHQPLCFIGQGMDVYRNQILATYPDAKIVEDNIPTGQSLVDIGFKSPIVEDIDQFVPEYLRQTQAEMLWAQKQSTEVLKNNNYIQDV
ncbi:tRNA (adenosine(37)-N6)-threonylcarbamoyltransferase complex dimerization subunit type 1 TsaB [Bombilactobacillus thymidiniphilus]|uniref:tRNA (Adenosine(37)-N6)-threonylcarbamoyltransferase complex dimerization subunit type 1 TsaB n=1 Tax=Bombilactobacillus thymidiniphilus TaxID=2923363 RepID=A0ABY4PDX0_9LACO|nr:tRNA (adenosine(37)-N6)-threonylcarbamoyltransferase complex dimerization subunit type 1 TsaB [Bombilactobacillus thymidiniphilus]UQS83921.1 tRNA (adenosine(37)-N6)-threonylcarbamoyltransferase complex dimerization subunit type 1 TsaB [Bombilactobacillus thymidiniphilus]